MKVSLERQNLASVAALQALEEFYINLYSPCSLDALPFLQNLKALFLWQCFGLEVGDVEAIGPQEPPALLSRLLPSLEVLDLMLPSQDITVVCQNLESFPSLRSLTLQCLEPGSFADVGEIGIPESCSVALKISAYSGAACELAAGDLPDALKASIREVFLVLPFWQSKYDLALFSACTAWPSLRLKFETCQGCTGVHCSCWV